MHITQQQEKPEIANIQADEKYIKSEIMAEQPNGLLCKYSKILNCVCTYNMPKEQYIRYWSGRYRNKPEEQKQIIDCCNEMFRTGLISTEDMLKLVSKSKDRPTEKAKIVKCLTQKVYYDINNDDDDEEI